MKAKKFVKTLSLKKQTVVNLEYGSMEKVKGGACTYTPTGCTEFRLCCTYGGNYNTCIVTYYDCTDYAPCWEVSTHC
jgi:hypothetical protein